MAKKITIFVLLAVLIGGAWWQNSYIIQAEKKLGALLAETEEALLDHDLQKAADAAEAFHQSWEKEKQYFEALLDHGDTDMISESSERLRSFCAAETQPHALAEAKTLKFYVRHLSELDSLVWENIF